MMDDDKMVEGEQEGENNDDNEKFQIIQKVKQ